MSNAEVTLYNCLYGMELFKERFASDEAMTKCMQRAIGFYKEMHSGGVVVGPLDFNQMVINLNTGDLTKFIKVSLEESVSRIDTLKFLPPEVINGKAGFGRVQDRYCLAMLLFAIRYYANPFDGMKTVASPIYRIDEGKAVYGNPVFIFDVMDKSNRLISQTHSTLNSYWENDPNTKIKDLFTTCFTAGISDYDMRPEADVWLSALDSKTESKDGRSGPSLFLEYENKMLKLSNGLSIFESNLLEGGSPDTRIAVVNQSKDGDFALENVSDDTWSVYMPDSREIMVTPRNAAPLVAGATISIGDMLINIISKEG